MLMIPRINEYYKFVFYFPMRRAYRRDIWESSRVRYDGSDSRAANLRNCTFLIHGRAATVIYATASVEKEIWMPASRLSLNTRKRRIYKPVWYLFTKFRRNKRNGVIVHPIFQDDLSNTVSALLQCSYYEL